MRTASGSVCFFRSYRVKRPGGTSFMTRVTPLVRATFFRIVLQSELKNVRLTDGCSIRFGFAEDWLFRAGIVRDFRGISFRSGHERRPCADCGCEDCGCEDSRSRPVPDDLESPAEPFLRENTTGSVAAFTLTGFPPNGPARVCTTYTPNPTMNVPIRTEDVRARSALWTGDVSKSLSSSSAG